MAVRVDDKKNIIIVTFAGNLAKDLVGSTVKEVNSIISRKKIKNVVFHLDHCLSAEENVLLEMAEIVQTMNRFKGGGRLIGVNDEVYKTLKETSLDRVLLQRSNLKSATTDMGFDFDDDELQELNNLIEVRVGELKEELKKQGKLQEEAPQPQQTEKKANKNPQMNVQFVNHFLLSTTKVLESQFSLPCKPGKPVQKKADDCLLLGDVCGLISIESEHFKGTLSISFPEDVFMKLVESVFGEETTEINDENIDLIAEIANIVLGDAKRKLAAEGYKVEQALPHVVWNKDKSLKHGKGLSIIIPYQTELGQFYTEVLTGRDLVELKQQLSQAA